MIKYKQKEIFFPLFIKLRKKRKKLNNKTVRINNVISNGLTFLEKRKAQRGSKADLMKLQENRCTTINIYYLLN